MGAGVGDKLGANDAFGGSGSQAHQRAGGFSGFPYRRAGFGRLIETLFRAVRPPAIPPVSGVEPVNPAETAAGNMVTSS